MKKLLALALALVMVLSLVACGGGSSSSTTEETAAAAEEAAAPAEEAAAPEEEAAAPAEGDDYKVLRYGTDANCTTFNPYADLNYNSSLAMVNLVAESLWDADKDGNITPVLASFEYNDDDTLFTVHCEEGIVFSNGNPFTAEDALLTFNGFRDNGRTANMVESLDLDNAVIVDDYTLEIPVNYYDAALVCYLAIPTYCVLDAETHAEDPDYGWVIGTGPYYLDEWEESVKYVLKRNDNWRGEPGYYDEIDIFFYAEESTRYADFQAGNLDVVFLTDASYINNLGNGAMAGAKLFSQEGLSIAGLTLSINEDTTAAFADINIRKALAHCIDTPSIVESLGEGTYVVPDSLYTKDCWAYIPGTGAYEYDPELAAEYLAEAGYGVDNPLTLTVYCSNTAWNTSLTEAVQFYASVIGIDLDLTGVADFGTILPVLIANGQDISVGSPGSNSGLDPELQLQQAASTSDNGQTRVAPSGEMDEILREANSSHDQAEREELYKQFAQMYHDEYIFIPMYLNTVNYGYGEALDFGACVDMYGYPDFYQLGK